MIILHISFQSRVPWGNLLKYNREKTIRTKGTYSHPTLNPTTISRSKKSLATVTTRSLTLSLSFHPALSPHLSWNHSRTSSIVFLINRLIGAWMIVKFPSSHIWNKRNNEKIRILYWNLNQVTSEFHQLYWNFLRHIHNSITYWMTN